MKRQAMSKIRGGQKKVYWNKGRPYCIHKETKEKIYFLSIHLQGEVKYYLYDYVVDNDTKKGILFRLKMLSSARRIKRKYREYLRHKASVEKNS